MQQLADLSPLERENEALRRENKILRDEVAWLKHHVFGRKTERLAPGQLAFAENGDPERPVATPEPSRAKEPTKTPAKGHGRAPFPEGMPREVIEVRVPDADRACPHCAEPMKAIGVEVTERGHLIPARMIVRRFEREKLACPKGHTVRTADAPAGVIDRAKFEASVYAEVVTRKYTDHVPLHRMERIFARDGVEIAKQTMWDMVVRVDELVAVPVLAEAKRQLLEEAVLHADETPYTVIIEDGPGAKGSKKAYCFVWRSVTGAGPPKVVVDFRMSRESEGATDFLGRWSGTLLTDGYAGYDEVVARNGIVRAGCWAHARRKFVEALNLGMQDAKLVLAPVQRLFWIERAIDSRAEARAMDRIARESLRTRVRTSRCRRVIADAITIAEKLETKPSTLPKSQLGKAIGYLLRQRGPLSAFLTDARLPMHNNDAERDIRHLAVGRKNWLVFGSPRGGEVACRLYSLVLSCMLNGVDPREYIEDVLGRLSTTPASRVAELTPWGWAAKRAAAEQSA